jgi:hypothetical protein
MAITVGGTVITFNDGTTQSTASGAPTTAQVLTATAAATAGAVGTYALMIRGTGTGSITTGTTFAGSSLRYCGTGTWSRDSKGIIFGNAPNAYQAITVGAASTGTWRCMGYAAFNTWTYNDASNNGQQASLFLRIS